MKILPAINTENFDEAKNRINLLKDLTKEFHIDISSLDFSNYQTWQNPKDIDRLEEDLKLHLHLMIRLKPQEILKWDNKRVKSFILHLEGTNLPDALIKFSKKTKKNLFIAWSPKIEKEFIERYIKFVDGILVLGVEPGKSGQEILEDTFERIKIAKNILSNKQKLIVDGGVNEENFEEIKKFEPDIIVLGSAIFGKENPGEEYLKFSKLVII
jgi:ribulose-phosphate 3-epimerase